MAMITIDGVDLPSPSVFKIPRSDLDSGDTGRNELGVLQRDRIRQGIYKIELEWKGINSSDLYLIESAIEPAELNVTFPTPTGMATKTMYAGDRNVEMVKYDKDFDKIRWNISFNLIEY
ncbi:DUF6711 family protein [Tepidimicrobium xylanilyticum]|uniref:DUF6711 family protein n=1 Tax=Tepidimicrobium xylanilyticum TaxID=1123352 RepID=UPI00264F69FC|nr:DUF6711 family protein [Tepidimicrobium xylanilyticum]GMG96860.1 hypothetical protein EN5CB1_16860 [Tepidimicrobium xylanilyticum]